MSPEESLVGRWLLNGAPEARQIFSLGRQPAGGSESWPRPGIAGHRTLAGDGVSRRPKAVSNPRVRTKEWKKAPEGRQTFGCGVSRSPPARTSVAAPRLMIFSAGILGLTPQAKYLSPLRGSGSHDDVSAMVRGGRPARPRLAGMVPRGVCALTSSAPLLLCPVRV